MENKKEKYKLYKEALKEYRNENYGVFHTLRQDRNLSKTERDLHLARHYINNKDFKNAKTVLEGMIVDDHYLKAEQLNLLSFVYNHLLDIENAIKFALDAIDFYKKIDDHDSLFYCYYNLSVYQNRLGLITLANYYLTFANQVAKTETQRVAVYRAIACNQSKLCDFYEATKSIENAFAHASKIPPEQLIGLKLVASDIYFRAGYFDKSKLLLDEISRKKNHADRSRALFELNLFEVFQNKRKIGIAPELVAKSKEFSLKWNLLKALQEGELSIARKYWQQLVEQNPSLYSDDFKSKNPSDEKSIFFQVLNQQFLLVEERPRTKLILKEGSKLYKLNSILESATVPLRKEALIEAIWDTNYDPKFDMRFYKLVERLKKLTGLNIINENFTYYIKDKRAA